MTAANETLLWSIPYTYIPVTNPVLLDLGPWPFWALLRVGLPWRPFPSSSALCWHVSNAERQFHRLGIASGPFPAQPLPRAGSCPVCHPCEALPAARAGLWSPPLLGWWEAAPDLLWCLQQPQNDQCIGSYVPTTVKISCQMAVVKRFLTITLSSARNRASYVVAKASLVKYTHTKGFYHVRSLHNIKRKCQCMFCLWSKRKPGGLKRRVPLFWLKSR